MVIVWPQLYSPLSPYGVELRVVSADTSAHGGCGETRAMVMVTFECRKEGCAYM